MSTFRHSISSVSLIAAILQAGCGVQPPPDPDATSPDRLPIVVPFDFSRAGNSVEVDFRVVAPRAERSSTAVDFGYFIQAPKPSGYDGFDALTTHVSSFSHPMRIELWEKSHGALAPVALFTSRYSPESKQFLEKPLLASNPVSTDSNPYDPEQGGLRVKRYHSDELYSASYSFAHTHELRPGHYTVRIQSLDSSDALQGGAKLIISHPFIGK